MTWKETFCAYTRGQHLAGEPPDLKESRHRIEALRKSRSTAWEKLQGRLRCLRQQLKAARPELRRKAIGQLSLELRSELAWLMEREPVAVPTQRCCRSRRVGLWTVRTKGGEYHAATGLEVLDVTLVGRSRTDHV